MVRKRLLVWLIRRFGRDLVILQNIDVEEGTLIQNIDVEEGTLIGPTPEPDIMRNITFHSAQPRMSRWGEYVKHLQLAPMERGR